MTTSERAMGQTQGSRLDEAGDDAEFRSLAVTDWEVLGLAEGEGEAIALAASTSPDWVPAHVPGGVHEALLAAGHITDPLAGDALTEVRWIEHRDWWFRGRFTALPEHLGRVSVVAEMLDTVAEVWLDGIRLGAHRNQFRPAAFDTELTTAGEHVLLVRLSPPLAPEDRDLLNGTEGTAQAATRLRKATFSWGWDFAPRLPSVGIGGDVRIEPSAVPRLVGQHAHTLSLSDDRSQARLSLHAQVDGTDAAELEITGLDVDFTLTAPDGVVHRASASVVDGVARAELTIDDPTLWWTHDLGKPALYDLDAALRTAPRSGSSVDDTPTIDRRTSRVGIRTIELDRSKDEDGEGRKFQFVLNGVPTFTRGANWVPPRSLVTSLDAELRRDLVLRAKEGNHTMLRVWGGGIYETDAFYDACDELGILVWQDFMFACVRYPGENPDFVDEVEREARYQVERLRGRTSLALWCGNNEIQAAERISRFIGRGVDEWGERIFHDLLPSVIDEIDPSTAYWPGSPWGEPADTEVNGVGDGDRHAWEVWHGNVGEPFFIEPSKTPTSAGDTRHWRRYADDTGRFISEFGVLSAADRGTLERWLPGATLHDPVFDTHYTDKPNDKLEELLSVTTGLPADIDEYVTLSQAAQAEAMLFAVEHFRRQQPHTAGTLIWQLNDCWPAMSWAMIDSDGIPKAAHYAVARASATVAASIKAADDGVVEVWVANNGLDEGSWMIDIEVGAFDGTERSTETVTAVVPPGRSHRVWSGPVAGDTRHYVWASSADAAFPAARLHFAELGELEVVDGRLDVETDDDLLRITAHGYAYGVHIAHPDARLRVTDNHFDLRDGETREIRVAGADPRLLEVRRTIPRGTGTATDAQ